MFFPDLYYDSVYEIPYGELWDKNIRFLIFDLDNTLAPYDAARPPAKAAALMKRLIKNGFKVCLLTNNTRKRINVFNEHLNLPTVHGAMKPLTRGVNRAIGLLGADRDGTAIIGDQIFSDVWAGNNAKIMSILVKPVSKKDIVTVRWKRLLEKPVLGSYLKKAGKRETS